MNNKELISDERYNYFKINKLEIYWDKNEYFS